MRNMAIALLVLGSIALIYGGISYNRNRTVMDMGSMSVTATEHRSIPISAVAGALILVGGVGLLVTDRRRSSTP